MGSASSRWPAAPPHQAGMLEAYDRIQRTAQDIVHTAVAMGWQPDHPFLCDYLDRAVAQGYRWLDLATVRDVNRRLGLPPGSAAPAVVAADERAARKVECARLAAYLRAKVQLAAYMRTELRPLCEEAQARVFANLPTQLQGADRATVEEAHKRYGRLVDVLYDWYRWLASKMDEVARPVTARELAALVSEVQRRASESALECCMAVDALREFAWEQVSYRGRVYYRNFAPGFDAQRAAALPGALVVESGGDESLPPGTVLVPALPSITRLGLSPERPRDRAPGACAARAAAVAVLDPATRFALDAPLASGSDSTSANAATLANATPSAPPLATLPAYAARPAIAGPGRQRMALHA